MEYELADNSYAVQSTQDVFTPYKPVSHLFDHSNTNNAQAPGYRLPSPTNDEDEDLYCGGEEGEVSRDDGNSRAGGWEPNVEYGDTLVMDDDHWMGIWEDFASHKTTTTAQFKRRTESSHTEYDEVKPHRHKRVKIEENVKLKEHIKGEERFDMSELPEYIAIDDRSPYENSAIQTQDSDLQRHRSRQRGVWIKPAEALTTAREHLGGDDLELFEALVERPAPGVGPMEKIDRWVWDTSGVRVRMENKAKAKTKATIAEVAKSVDHVGASMGIKYGSSVLGFL